MRAPLGRSHVVFLVARGKQTFRRKEPRPIRGVFAVVDSHANFKPDAILPGQRTEVLLPLDSPGGSKNRDFFRENDDLSPFGRDLRDAIVVTQEDGSGIG